MVISFINESTTNARRKELLEKALSSTFKYVEDGEVDVVFDFKSPTASLGVIDILMFINIEKRDGNYYRTYPTKDYLHTLVVGIKKVSMDDVIDADSQNFYNEEGSWNYEDEISAENKAFDNFCYSACPQIKYFKSALFYYVQARNCSKTMINDYIFLNSGGLNIPKLLDIACQRCRSKVYRGAWSMQFNVETDIHHFVSSLIDEAEAKTRQGILTKKKMDSIVKDSKLINLILNAMGARLCVINGNAGAGKTLALMRIAYRTVSHEFDKEGENRSHNVRLLTYNNMLVCDIRNVLKSMGTFTASNLSTQTLHKFFYDLFKNAPAVWGKYSGDIVDRINKLMKTCDERIQIINQTLVDSYQIIKTKELNPFIQISNYEEYLNSENPEQPTSVIASSNRKEADMYFRFLMTNRRWDEMEALNNLDLMRESYISEKKQMAIDSFLNNVFLTEYESILQDMYFLVTDRNKFIEEHDLKSKWDFYEFVFNTDNVDDNINNIIDDSIEGIKNKVNWSHAILIDEAQDCSIYEKALLYAIRGCENIVIATGGKDQLIRKGKENDWTVLFGKRLEKEFITLKRTNWRQKSNIVTFLNAFAERYNLESKKLQSPPETENKGKVIIDIRNMHNRSISLDKLASLRNQGKAYGCSDFENLMVLLPHFGYTNSNQNGTNVIQPNRLRATVDITDTITFQIQRDNSIMDIGHKDYDGTKDMRVYDCTINAKGDLNPGQCDTRFLFYDSCRGLEAWNVMCIDLDSFFWEKRDCEEARNYAIEQSGLIQEDQSLFQTHYAAIWCFMALTRPMDTLYISLHNMDNDFSKEILEIAKSCGDAVEILE